MCNRVTATDQHRLFVLHGARFCRLPVDISCIRQHQAQVRVLRDACVEYVRHARRVESQLAGAHAMTTIHFLRRTAIVAAFAVAGGVAVPLLVSVTLASTPPAEWDGLVRVENRRLDHMYLLPDVSFAGYTRVRLDPVEVSFARNWNPNRSPSQRLRPSDVQNIKSALANEFRRVFSDALTRAGYKLVDEDGDDVLRVQAAIVNLYITAPSAAAQGRSRTFIANTGQMTLVAELRDSVTGQLLARAVDTIRGRGTGQFQLASPVTNMADARRALSQWADVLVTGIGDAEGRAPAAQPSS